jgi:hypothetical protein
VLYNVGQFPGSPQDISGWEFANTNKMHAYPKSLKKIYARTYIRFLLMIREEGHVLLNFLSLYTAAVRAARVSFCVEYDSPNWDFP